MSQHLYGEVSDPTAMYKLIEDLLNTYQRKLEEEDAVASGELRDAADYSRGNGMGGDSFVLDWQGTTLMLSLYLPEHWYYVEEGRSPNNGQSGKPWADPVGDIMRWMELKHIAPRVRRAAKRRTMTRPSADPKRQAAKAIVHKIFTRGFYTSGKTDVGPKGKHPLQHAIEEVDLVERMKNVLTDQFNRAVHVALTEELGVRSQNSK